MLKAISSPSIELTDCMRSTICRSCRPVSEFHHAPNAAFSEACCSASATAWLILPFRLGTAP